jgi:hypothetical protein
VIAHHDDNHDHCDGEEPDGPGWQASDATISVAEMPHLHFEWLGFLVTLSDNDTDRPVQGRDDHRTYVSVLTRAANDLNAALQVGPASARPPTADLAGVLPDEEPAAARTVAAAAPRGTLSLLCDRARHERSGVQLI